MAAQHENALDQPQPERYYREYITLPADEDSARGLLREVFYERMSRGWKLISATKDPSGDDLLLERGRRLTRYFCVH